MKNKFWQDKMKHQFSCLDTDKNGVLSPDDFERLADRLIECGKLNETQGERVRKNILAFWPGISNGKETVTEADFIIGLSSALDGN